MALSFENKAILAPMAGVSDYAFRTVCARRGTEITVTEMVSSRALCYQDQKSIGLLKKTPLGICGAQIFGNEPEIMARAARFVLKHGDFDFIDINMGCPVGKISGNGDGCALMRDPALAARIVEAVKKAVPVPVTVKCRKGWDKGNVNAVEFAKTIESAGADAIAVHGRTKTMLYSGVADWDIIREVKKAVGIPVVANGDIFDPERALSCRARTGADGYMIGRGAFGDPFLVGMIASALRGEPVPARPKLYDRIGVALEQFGLACEDKGEHIACLEARKQFSWYLRGIPHGGYYKEKIGRLETAAEFYAIAEGIRNDLRDPE